LGSPGSFSLCEFGPGRGALMKAIVESVAKDREMAHVKVNVHMVENSVQLQRIQSDRVGLPIVHQSNVSDFGDNVGLDPVIILAHEYFDALPIYRFQHRPEMGWCEEMIALDDSDTATHPFQFVLSPGPTPAAIVCLGPNPPSDPGRLEVCPDAQASMQTIAKVVAKNSGVALVIDYGQFGPSVDSLRAIRNHKFVDLFEPAGECDLSANVDFRMLSNAARQSGLKVSACLTQRDFLARIGIQMLLMQMLKSASSEEEGELIVSEYNRLVDDMGEIYKVMVFASDSKLVTEYQ
jgi:NADH dehydrogenase [ubiquinone] 1 alpha subcomplex assembly factor 7